MFDITIVIPHKNRPGILNWHLEQYKYQTYNSRFMQVLVVDDHSSQMPDVPEGVKLVVNDGHGPAAARNTGAREADGKIVLFVGDDCIPGKDLAFFHIIAHETIASPGAVQGYTPFHPQVMASEFMRWLDVSGLQANWNALKDESGEWASAAGAYCLTTNYSIDRELFLTIGGFDEKNFPDPAWEDVAFGYLLNMAGVQALFTAAGQNYHFHQYNLDQFCGRQFMVGRNLLNLVTAMPEVGANILMPESLREMKGESLAEWLETAKLIEKSPTHADARLHEIKGETWSKVISLAAGLGTLAEANRRGGPWRVIEHLHGTESVMMAAEGIRAAKESDYGFALHVIGWMTEKWGGDWAVRAYAGDLYEMLGMNARARNEYWTSTGIAPSEWANKELEKYDNA